ncbi:MAG: hypothetical protein RI554_05555 [Trueperaceae bacterium]|nr:hypothetical protein [Trueperaceae bacterium]
MPQLAAPTVARSTVAALALAVVGLGAILDRGAPVDLRVEAEVRVLDAPLHGAHPDGPAHGPPATPTLRVRATGYNSLPEQTDATPDVTATGTSTRFGVVAVSRDLLSDDLPYGSLVRLTDLGSARGGGAGYFQSLLDRHGPFVVEDTMHARKTNQLDVWFEDYASAVAWGVRNVEVTVVRYGYDGPHLDRAAAAFDGPDPLLARAR